VTQEGALAKKIRCGGRVVYEEVNGVLVRRRGPMGSQDIYQARCEKCGATWENTGTRTKKCQVILNPDPPPPTPPPHYDIATEDGKYRFILHHNGRLECRRYDEDWIYDWEAGPKAVIALVDEVERRRPAPTEGSDELPVMLTATVRFKSYLPDEEGLADRVRYCIETHPTHSFIIESIELERS